MKSLLTLSFLLMASSIFAQTWEWQTPTPQGNDLLDVACHSGNHLDGWIVGEYGTLLHIGPDSSIGLASFSSREYLTGVSSVSTDTFIVVTGQGSIYRTTNDGSTWERVFSDTNACFYAVAFSSPRNGWAAGERLRSTVTAAILHTTDGGGTWSPQSEDVLPYVEEVFFQSDSAGWMMGDGSIVRTTDGGSTWSPISEGSYIQHLFFASPTRGWGSRWESIMTTTDGGATWTAQTASGPAQMYWNSFYFVNVDTGFAFAGGGDIYLTTDGGTEWSRSESYTYMNIAAVDFSCYPYGAAVGMRGGIYVSTDGGQEWNWRGYNASLRDWLLSVSFCDPLHGWAVGSGPDWGGNIILHTADGGHDWEQQLNHWDAKFNDVKAIDSLRAYAVGDYGGIFVTSDGGTSWLPQFSGSECFFGRVQFLNADSGYVLPQYTAASLLRTTDGGQNWDTVAMEYERYHGMKFVDMQNGWVTTGSSGNTPGEIYHTSDGGQSWRGQTSVTYPLEDVDFLDLNNGWAVGDEGEILHTTNGGAVWTPVNGGSNEGFGRVRMLSLNTIYILKAGYTTPFGLLRTTDGGATWQQELVPAGGCLEDLCILPSGDAWAVGHNENGGGIILHANDFPSLAVSPKPRTSVAHSFSVSAYPNPFNPTTILSFDVPKSSRVTLNVYDLTGRLVQTLADRVYPQGNFRINFDGSNLASGIYFARLQGNSFSKTQKLVLLK